ncbi:MAG: hypothetical protein HYY16_06870 [Planctomycetes bacterium]|nr:hypothetical protein [Planctomycetota bacterium]
MRIIRGTRVSFGTGYGKTSCRTAAVGRLGSEMAWAAVGALACLGLSAALDPGCASGELSLESTPCGFLVHVPEGPSLKAGPVTREEIFAWLEGRVHQWVERRAAAYDRDHLYRVARGYHFILHDGHRFRAAAGPTGAVAGLHRSAALGTSVIEAAIWTRARPGAVRCDERGDSFGCLENDAVLAVLSHELDHAIGIHHP